MHENGDFANQKASTRLKGHAPDEICMLPEPGVAARGAWPRLVADPLERVNGVFVRSGEAVLGGEPVLDGEDEDVELVGHAGARLMERRGRCAEDDESATVEVDHQRQLTAASSGGGEEHAEESLLGGVQGDVPRASGGGGGGGGVGGGDGG